MARLLKDLLIALLNATLVLTALCLWLTWQTSNAINGAVSEFAKSLVGFEPMREDIQLLASEITELRADLATFSYQSADAKSQNVRSINSKLEALETRVSRSVDQLEMIARQPEVMVDYAIDQTALRLKTGLDQYWGCRASNQDFSEDDQ